MPPTASTRRLSGGTYTVSSVPTGCRRRGGRPGAGTAAVTATWTICTSRSDCAWKWTAAPPSGRGQVARYTKGQRQPGPGSADAEVRLARRHRVPLPDRRGDRRRPAPPGLDGHVAPVRAGVHRGPAAEKGSG